MTIFISYARRDEAAVRALQEDLVRARHDVWFDRELEGGQAWWEAILEQIRSCDLFVFALSPDSVRSRPCLAELAYAVALRRPLLPVRVRDVNEQLAPAPIPTTQIADYRQRTPETVIDLTNAVARTTSAVPLPEPLPEPPAAPVADIAPLRERVGAPSLTLTEQQELVDTLRRRSEDDAHRDAVLALLRELRERPDLAEGPARETDALISRLAVTPAVADEWGGTRSAPRAVAGLDPDLVDLLRSVVSHIRGQRLTPILGLGLTDGLIGPRQRLARQWAQTFEFPMARHQQEDLPHVAQFVAVMTDRDTLQSSLRDYLRERLQQRYPDLSPAGTEWQPGELVVRAWEQQRSVSPAEPHSVLARMPCPLYVTTHPADLLSEALRREGRAPETELCRWRQDVYDWPDSVFDREPDYVPSADRPLVFHVFGRLELPESLVLTEDDHFEFLASVAADATLVPVPVSRALADSALLFLGFGLEDWDVRILLRSLISQEGARRLQKYTHVAAQIDLDQSVLSPARARRYLERYFGRFRKPSIDIFWGSVEEFTSGLHEVWEPAR
jgi:hypothetical protein